MGMTEGITINHKVKSNSSELAQVSLLVRELIERMLVRLAMRPVFQGDMFHGLLIIS